ncbi:MAG: hypothetical protein V4591_07725 [Bdellovibrionota bacterium]
MERIKSQASKLKRKFYRQTEPQENRTRLPITNLFQSTQPPPTPAQQAITASTSGSGSHAIGNISGGIGVSHGPAAQSQFFAPVKFSSFFSPSYHLHVHGAHQEMSFLQNMERLRNHSDRLLGQISTEIDGIHVRRKSDLLNFERGISEHPILILYGPKGVGKSALVKTYLSKNEHYSQLAFHANDFNGQKDMRAFFTQFGIEVNKDLYPQAQDKLLYVDSTEQLTHILFAFKEVILFFLECGWRIVLSCVDTEFDWLKRQLREIIELEKIEKSPTISDNLGRMIVSKFNDDHCKHWISKHPSLRTLYYTEEYQEILKIPYYLKLLYQILAKRPALSKAEMNKEFWNTGRGILQIRRQVWQQVIMNESVTEDSIHIKRGDLAIKLCLAHLENEEVDFQRIDGKALRCLIQDQLITDKGKPAHSLLIDCAMSTWLDEQLTGDNFNFNILSDDKIGNQLVWDEIFVSWLSEAYRKSFQPENFVDALVKAKGLALTRLKAIFVYWTLVNKLDELAEKLLNSDRAIVNLSVIIHKQICYPVHAAIRSENVHLLELVLKYKPQLKNLKTLNRTRLTNTGVGHKSVQRQFRFLDISGVFRKFGRTGDQRPNTSSQVQLGEHGILEEIYCEPPLVDLSYFREKLGNDRYFILTRLLLENGADPNEIGVDRVSILPTIITLDEATLKLTLKFLKNGVNFNIRDASRCLPLDAAIKCLKSSSIEFKEDATMVIKALLKRGAISSNLKYLCQHYRNDAKNVFRLRNITSFDLKDLLNSAIILGFAELVTNIIKTRFVLVSEGEDYLIASRGAKGPSEFSIIYEYVHKAFYAILDEMIIEPKTTDDFGVFTARKDILKMLYKAYLMKSDQFPVEKDKTSIKQIVTGDTNEEFWEALREKRKHSQQIEETDEPSSSR